MTATASGSAAPHGAATEEELGPARNRLSWNAMQVFLHARAPFFTSLPASRGPMSTVLDTFPKETVGAPDQMTASQHGHSEG
jgi:hypothetical protein